MMFDMYWNYTTTCELNEQFELQIKKPYKRSFFSTQIMKTIAFLKPRQSSVEAGGTEGPKETTGYFLPQVGRSHQC